MVVVRGLDRGVGPEALALGVVVVVDLLAGPVALALDAEVVVRPHGEQAVPAVGFENTLSEGDACRDSVALHLGDGDGFVSVDILFAGGADLGRKRKDQPEEETCEECCFSGNFH